MNERTSFPRQVYRTPPRRLPRGRTDRRRRVSFQRRPHGHHNGLCRTNHRRGLCVRLEGNGVTHQSRARIAPAVGVALSGATAATFRNVDPGSGERLRLHYVSLYRSAPRGVHCSYWNQACVCALLSSSTPWSRRRRLLLLPLPSSSSRYVRVYVERARYAHRPSNRGATRVKSTPRSVAEEVRERARVSRHTTCN